MKNMESEEKATIASKLESVLFLHGEPLSVPRLSEILSIDELAVEEAIETLSGRYVSPYSGIMLIRKGSSVELATAPKNVSVVESMLSADREETLGKASLETLSVIAYRGPVSRVAIDAIRGVNSSFSLRNLSLRGLVDRRPNPNDSREFEYVLSFRLLEALGLGSVDELPEYSALSRETDVVGSERDDSGTKEPDNPTE
jgi:segregation and condensation protein B